MKVSISSLCSIVGYENDDEAGDLIRESNIVSASTLQLDALAQEVAVGRLDNFQELSTLGHLETLIFSMSSLIELQATHFLRMVLLHIDDSLRE